MGASCVSTEQLFSLCTPGLVLDVDGGGCDGRPPAGVHVVVRVVYPLGALAGSISFPSISEIIDAASDPSIEEDIMHGPEAS